MKFIKQRSDLNPAYRQAGTSSRNLNDIFGQIVYFRDGQAFYCRLFY